MGIFTRNKISDLPTEDAPQPFCVSLDRKTFCDFQVQNLYRKIVQRTLNRCAFESKDQEQIIASWQDSLSGDGKGLISYLSMGIAENDTQVALKYDPVSGVLRKMTSAEVDAHKKAGSNKPKYEIIFDFSCFTQAKVARFYFDRLYDLNLIRSRQWGIAGLTVLTAGEQTELDKMTNRQADNAMSDAARIARGITTGRMLWLSKGSNLTGVSSINSDIIKTAREDLFKEMSASLGIPLHFLTNEPTTGGLGDYSESDIRAENELIKEFYFMIAQPCMTKLYGVSDVSLIDDTWRTLESRARTLGMIEQSEFWATRKPKFKEKIWEELLGIVGDTNLEEEDDNES